MNLITRKFLLNFTFLAGLLVGLSVFIGWVFEIQNLKTSFFSNNTLKINSSISLMLICCSYLLFFNNKKYKIVALFGLITIVFALLTVSQNIFKFHIGIDQFLFLDQENILKKHPFPGRPSPITSFCLLLFGISIIGIIQNDRIYKLFAQYALHLVTLISFVALMGYFFSVPQFYKLAFLSAIPSNGAVSFFLLSIAASFLNQNLGITGLFSSSKIGSTMARNLFPKVLISVIFLGYIMLIIQGKQIISVEFGIALFATSFILVTFYFITVTAKTLNQVDSKKQIAENELLLLNENLEKIIEERTADLKATNLELEKNKQHFKNIFNVNAAATVIYSIEKDNEKFLEVNDGFENMLGYSRKEVEGKNAVDLKIISKENFKSIKFLMKKNGYSRNVETTLITKDEIKLTVLCSINYYKKDNIESVLCSFVNISQRIEEELKLKRMSDFLIKQNKQLESFSFIVSHNLRGSTSNLVSLLYFYKDQNDKEGQDFIMAKVEQTVNNLSNTLNNLLEIISIKSDRKIEKEEIFFDEVFLKLQQTYQGEIMKYDVDLTYNFLKAPKIDYFPPYLESIAHNLLSNAIKYSDPNRKPIIKFETFIIDDLLYMKVSDNGLGIDLQKNGKHLFGFNKIFHRHPEAKGIGLFITKAQIESMGGEIRVESEIGKGTTFTIIFNNNNLK